MNERKEIQGNIKPKANIKDVIDATANMHIGSNEKQQHKPVRSQGSSIQTPQQSQQQQRSSTFEEMFPQAKCFPYNPYKIMGFQNKETNEFAMNVLKTQLNTQPKGANNNPNTGVNNINNNNNRGNPIVTNAQSNIKHGPPQQIPFVPIQQTVQAQPYIGKLFPL